MEQFWFDRPLDLVNKDYALFFYPNDKMTMPQKLNSMLRLSIYFAVVMIVFTSNLKFLLVPLVVAIVTCLVYKNTPAKKLRAGEIYDGFDEGACTVPSKDNPFMNVLMNEYEQRPDRSKACDVGDSKVRTSMSKQFDKDLYRDVGDIFNNAASDRQYYTTANTQIPNDQGGFAKWLYDDVKSCKEPKGGAACARNIGISTA
jgi:hypothetical protein